MENQMSFSSALEAVKNGLKMQRIGWNGKGMYIEIQKPDVNSKMTLPYIFLKTADENFIPWTPSHTDLFSNDFVEFRNP